LREEPEIEVEALAEAEIVLVDVRDQA